MKKAVFLLGSMGAGKSTLIQMATFVKSSGFITHCKEYDILGPKMNGADSLSGHSKPVVWSSLHDYQGKLIIAGQYYSAQKDVPILQAMGFSLACVFLLVSRDTVYRRVVARGSGLWKEETYNSNLKSRLSFYRNFKGPKQIWRNETMAESKANYQKLIEL